MLSLGLGRVLENARANHYRRAHNLFFAIAKGGSRMAAMHPVRGGAFGAQISPPGSVSVMARPFLRSIASGLGSLPRNAR